MFQFLYLLLQAAKLILVPLCFVTAWAFVVLLGLTVWSFIRQSVSDVKRLHKIPCANCQFFTGNYFLKCTVHPTWALTEEATNCSDFSPHKKVY